MQGLAAVAAFAFLASLCGLHGCSDLPHGRGQSTSIEYRLTPGITFARDIDPTADSFDMDDMTDVASQDQTMMAGSWRLVAASAARCSAAGMSRCSESECAVSLLLRASEQPPKTMRLQVPGRPTDLYLDADCTPHLVGTRSTEIRHVTRTPSQASFRAIVAPDASIEVTWRTTMRPTRTLQALIATGVDAEIGLAVELEGDDKGASWIVGYGAAGSVEIRRRALPDLGGYVHASNYGGAIAERGGTVVAVDGSSLGPPWESAPGVLFATVSRGNALLAGRRLTELHIPGEKGLARLRSLTGLAISARDEVIVAGHGNAGDTADWSCLPFVAAYDLDLQPRWVWRSTTWSPLHAATAALPVVADSGYGRVVRLGGDEALDPSATLAAFGLFDPQGPAKPVAGAIDLQGVAFAAADSHAEGRPTFALRSADGLAMLVTDGWGRVQVATPDPCGGDGDESCSDGDPTTIDRCTEAGCQHVAKAESDTP